MPKKPTTSKNRPYKKGSKSSPALAKSLANVHPAWTIKAKNDIHMMELNIPEDADAMENWEQYVLVNSDWHADNAHFDKVLWKKHMNQAKKRDAAVFAFGDLFCAMQGRLDARRSRSAMKKSVDHDDYFDRIVDELDGLTEPYAANMAFMSPGNHELAPLKYNSTNLIKRLEGRLKRHNSPVCSGGIGGWIFVRGVVNGKSQTVKVAYHHGAGGGGAVTKGVPQHARRAAYLPQADVFFSGHIHQSWRLALEQEEITPQGHRRLKRQDHVCLATYKQEYTPEESDFHTALERPPKPLGGCWMRFFCEYSPRKNGMALQYELIEAK
jgi:hypothetical protein